MTEHFVQGDVLIPMRPKEAEIALTIASHMSRCAHALSGRFGENRHEREAQQAFLAVAHEIAQVAHARHAHTVKPHTITLLQSYIESMVDYGIHLPMCLDIHKTSAGETLGLRLTDNRNFSDEATAYLVHVLVCEFDLPAQGFTYSKTADEVGIDHFGGGAVYVSRHGIRFQDANDFLRQAQKEDSLDLPAAAREGNLFRLEKLLSEGADPNMEDGLALKWAAREKKANAFETLLQHGANPDTPGLDDLVRGEAPMEAALQAARMAKAIEMTSEVTPEVTSPRASSITRRSI